MYVHTHVWELFLFSRVFSSVCLSVRSLLKALCLSVSLYIPFISTPLSLSLSLSLGSDRRLAVPVASLRFPTSSLHVFPYSP